MNQDSAFFWEGVEDGELRIQRCGACKELRHPPGPMCPRCHSLDWDAVRSSGNGEVYSFVIHHHPPVHGFETPFAIAVIELEEGTRIVGNIPGVPLDKVEVGMPVEIVFDRIDNEWTLPQWRPREDPKK